MARTPAWAIGLLGLVALHAAVATASQPPGLVAPPPPSAQPAPPASLDPADLAPRSAAAPLAVHGPGPCHYRGIVPGAASPEEAAARLGEPEQRRAAGGGQIWTYRPEGLRRLDVEIRGGRVAALVLHFEQPASPDDLAGRFGWRLGRPARVVDGEGRPLGLAYPEHGLLLAYAEGGQELVEHASLGPLDAEAFLLRAAQAPHWRLQWRLEDVERALELAPRRAEALRRRAELLAAAGRLGDALAAAERALEAAPEDASIQLTWARLETEAGRTKPARPVLASLAQSSQDAVVRAEAQRVLAAAEGGAQAQQQAVALLQSAIRLASAALQEDSEEATRPRLLRTLIEAHLDMAQVIAEGQWRRRETTLKWLGAAARLAERAIDQQAADADLKPLVLRRSLACYAALPQETAAAADLDPAPLAEAVLRTTAELSRRRADPIYQAALVWQAGEALFDAAKLELGRERPEAAMDWIQRAVEALAGAPADSPRNDFLLGRLAFLAGSIEALARDDLSAAVAWFDRAAPRLTSPGLAAGRFSKSQQGQWLLAMADVYQRAGRHADALRLARHGVDALEQAAGQGRATAEQAAQARRTLARFSSAASAPETDSSGPRQPAPP